ncbi:MAG: hypothetical protein QNK22_01845 [Xanthomonadales bacterium]|nr:hypothetical protein [Xanthomonadales bacterium]
MTISFEFFEKDAYLLAKISDKSLNPRRAELILKSINAECEKCNCRKVLLNELSLEERKVANHELPGLSENIRNIRLAFLCQPELIDDKAMLFGALTFAGQYTMKHFCVESEAIQWLHSAPIH